MQLNMSDPVKILLMTAEVIDGKSRLYLSNVGAAEGLSRGELIQQPLTASSHPDDRIDSIAVSPGQQRGCGVLAISSRSSWRADLLVGEGSGQSEFSECHWRLTLSYSRSSAKSVPSCGLCRFARVFIRRHFGCGCRSRFTPFRRAHR